MTRYPSRIIPGVSIGIINPSNLISYYYSLMEFEDEIVLGPLQKYQKLNIPPYKAVVALLLMVFTTIETLTIIHSNVHSNVHQIKSFTYLYFDSSNYTDSIFIESQHFHIRDTQDLIYHFQYMFDNLNSIDSTSFQHLSFSKAKMRLYSHYQTIDISDSDTPVYDVNISDGEISEPFSSTDPVSIQNYLFNISRFDIRISDIELNVSGINTLWTHQISYEFSYSAELEIHLSFQTQQESDFSPQDIQGYYFRELSVFYAIVIGLALAELFLSFRFFVKLILWLIEYSDRLSRRSRVSGKESPKYLYQTTAQWMIANDIQLRKLSFEEWLSLVDFWNILSTLGNGCQIIGSVLLIFKFRGSGIVGLGCMIAWLGVFKYLKYIPKFIVLNSVLERSIPKLVVFMVEFIPSFVAFMLFATAAFWKVEQFSSAMKTLNVQMCMMLGDSIEMFTNEIGDKRGKAIAMFYTFGFVLSFMHALHNLVTALIKEHFIRYKVDRARMKLEIKGMEHKTSIQQLKPSYQQMKATIDVDYSALYQNQMIRKEVKGIMDTTIKKIQSSALALNQMHKKLEDDFYRNLKYCDISVEESKELRREIKDKLKSSQIVVERLRKRVSQMQG